MHAELAVRTVRNDDGTVDLKPFRDHDVHRVLINSGIPKKQIKGSTSKEWFAVDLVAVKKANDAVKKGQPNFTNAAGETFIPIVFRPEQEDAIANTIKQSGYAKTIIITHRPVVDKGWYEDFGKIFHYADGYLYGSKNTGADIDYLTASDKEFVYFASIQDLRGSSTVGGKFDKNMLCFHLTGTWSS